MDYSSAEELAKKIQSDVPGAQARIEPDVQPHQYFVDVISRLRFVVRDEDQWKRRREELAKFKGEEAKRMEHG